MTIKFEDLNRAGLSQDVIAKYQSTEKVKRYINLMQQGVKFPPIQLYKNTNTIADGIHRICSYLFLGITEFEYN